MKSILSKLSIDDWAFIAFLAAMALCFVIEVMR